MTVAPVEAATVIVVRDGPPPAGARVSRIEVLLLRRHAGAGFAAGAHVFPGGAVDGGDRTAEAAAVCAGRSPAEAGERLGRGEGGLALWVAAVRECFEEAGVLLAAPAGPGGPPAGPDGLLSLADPADAARFAGHRRDVHAGRRPLAAVCRAEGLCLALDRLHYFSHWITPEGSPRRFDTRFFVARAPAGQVAGHDEGETTAALWLGVEEALERHRAGALAMVLPTVKNLEAVARHRDCGALVEATAGRAWVPTVAPTIVPGPEGPRIVLPEVVDG